ncbi:MAG: alpha/beta hydrolase [Myxococcales bacterium]|nr:alpha/beta hydrolase [Myxococcales bacterium]
MSAAIRVQGRQVAYETFGSGGPQIVALPGIGDTRASYRHLAPLLVQAGFTVHAMDLRGHGESDSGFGSYTSEDIGDDVVALLDELDLQGAILLGNSVGAAASAHASLCSSRVAGFVSLSGFVSDPPYFGLIRPLLSIAFGWPWGVSLWGRYRKTLFATPPADLEENHSAVLQNLREPGRLRAVRLMMCASKAATAARLHEVSVPALIAMGAQDPDFPDPAAEAKRQADELGGDNSVVMIEGAGHYPQVERPQETAAAIEAFVKRTVQGGA